MSLVLYDLEKELMAAYELYSEAVTQEDIEAAEALLFKAEMAVEKKCVGCAHIYVGLKLENEVIEKEIDRLKAKLKSNERAQDWLKNKIDLAMETARLDKIKDSFRSIWKQKSKRVEITNESLVPEEYIRTKVIKEVNKTAVKEAWEKGVGVAGTTVIEEIQVRIK